MDKTMTIVNDRYNGVRVIMDNNGKYGVQEVVDGVFGSVICNYRSLDSANKTAQTISDENDRADAMYDDIAHA